MSRETATSQRSTWTIMGIILVLLCVVFYVFYSGGEQWHWGESYYPEDDQPYGGKVLSEMMQAWKGDQFVSLEDSLVKVMDTLQFESPATYMYYGRDLYVDSLELEVLLDFVEDGNSAFILSRRFSPLLFDTLFYREEQHYIFDWQEEALLEGNVWDQLGTVEDTLATMHTDRESDAGFDIPWIVYQEIGFHQWNHFEYYDISEDEYADVLGHFTAFDDWQYEEEFINFVGVPFGAGTFYLHSTPEAFTNYNLRRPEAYEYAAWVMENVAPGDLLWDEHNRFPSFGDPSSSPPRDQPGPLSFIQSQPALRAALYLLLALLVVYLIFGLKRRQAPIPVLRPKANTSIEFSEVLSQLYLNQRDHRKLGLLKMRLWQAFVLERYGIRAKGKEPEDLRTFGKQVAVKANLPPERLEELMDSYRNLTVVFNVDNALLVQFHQQLEYFYRNCK